MSRLEIRTTCQVHDLVLGESVRQPVREAHASQIVEFAARRKLLTILNTMLKKNRPWMPKTA